jgi:hypothetical protein
MEKIVLLILIVLSGCTESKMPECKYDMVNRMIGVSLGGNMNGYSISEVKEGEQRYGERKLFGDYYRIVINTGNTGYLMTRFAYDCLVNG